MRFIYLLSLHILPIVLVISFFTEGIAKSWLITLVMVLSLIILFVKVGWFITWKDAYKHGVKLSKLSALGASPISGLYTIIAVISYIFGWIWMIITNTSTWNLIYNIVWPAIPILGLWLFYFKNR